MNEFERKLYLKFRKYDAIIMPQVISIKTFYTSKRTSFFTFLLFLNVLPEFEDFGYTCNFESVFFSCNALFE